MAQRLTTFLIRKFSSSPGEEIRWWSSLYNRYRAKIQLIKLSKLNLLELLKPANDGKKVNLVFIDKDGKETAVEANIGDSLLKIGQDNKLPIEGACDSSLACSTCHVYVDPKFMHLMPNPEDGEQDMLDMAPFLLDTSRLGCQIKVTSAMEGMKVKLPPATRNFYVDDKIPEPH